MVNSPAQSGAYAQEETASHAELVAWAAIGAILSVSFTGFVLGVANNLFHLPIMSALFDETQYRDDAFVQSLRYYASGLWLVLRGSEKYVDPFWLFLSLHVASRFLAFIGFLLCAGLIGIRSRCDIIIFTLLLSACSLMRGASYAGFGGLFTNNFTHSELANGLTLLLIYFIVRGRIVQSFTINGAVFFINAFVAVWNAAPLLLVIGTGLQRRQIKIRKVLVHGGGRSVAISANCVTSHGQRLSESRLRSRNHV